MPPFSWTCYVFFLHTTYSLFIKFLIGWNEFDLNFFSQMPAETQLSNHVYREHRRRSIVKSLSRYGSNKTPFLRRFVFNSLVKAATQGRRNDGCKGLMVPLTFWKIGYFISKFWQMSRFSVAEHPLSSLRSGALGHIIFVRPESLVANTSPEEHSKYSVTQILNLKKLTSVDWYVTLWTLDSSEHDGVHSSIC